MCAEMGSNMLQKELIDKLHKNSILSADEFYKILSEHDEEDSEYLFGLARKVRENIYGKDVYIRGGAEENLRNRRLLARADRGDEYLPQRLLLLRYQKKQHERIKVQT